MQYYPIIRKVPASSVAYGTDISTRGGYVWCAYDDERLVAVAATVTEVKRLYRKAQAKEASASRRAEYGQWHTPGGG